MNTYKASLMVCMLIAMSCVSIPPEAPELSASLGKRISQVETANITLLHRFFDQKRQEVDRFIEEEWVPSFSEEFFSNPVIEKAWQTIVREDDATQRLTFLINTGPKLQKKINEKRLELIQPLDDLERTIENHIRDEYAQMKAMNNSITSFLLSSSEVVESRNRYLGMVGVSETRINGIIDKTDSAVANLLAKGENVQDKAGKAQEFLEKISSIKNSL